MSNKKEQVTTCCICGKVSYNLEYPMFGIDSNTVLHPRWICEECRDEAEILFHDEIQKISEKIHVSSSFCNNNPVSEFIGAREDVIKMLQKMKKHFTLTKRKI